MTTATAPATTYPAVEAVIDVARPRVQRIHRGKGFYPVTVGGHIVGAVQKVGQKWAALDEHGDAIGGPRAARTGAVALVASTPGAAEAYRVAARAGAFGYEERRIALRAEMVVDAELNALDNGKNVAAHLAVLADVKAAQARTLETKDVAIDDDIYEARDLRADAVALRARVAELTAVEREQAAPDAAAAPAAADLTGWDARLTELADGLDLTDPSHLRLLGARIEDDIPDAQRTDTLRALAKWLGAPHRFRSDMSVALDIANLWRDELGRRATAAERKAAGVDPFARIPQAADPEAF